MKNVENIKDCFGCGICSIACSRKIISIRLNRDGFYQPFINHIEDCVNCGLCVDVCAFSHSDRALPHFDIHSWAAWSKDSQVRYNCSSGGIGYEIAKQLIEKGFEAVVCRYNVESQRAEHYIASTVEELKSSIGSKYIQSYTSEAFSRINRKNKYIVIGTPCQIDSFRRYIQKFHCEQNFVLVDFFCHGVPSKLLWDKYVAFNSCRIGKLKSVSWRNKETGWHDSYAMKLIGENQEKIFSLKSKGDIFYKMFLGDYCNNPACSKNCKYKYDASSSDIRIGDLWGKVFANDEKGVSALISFTAKGKEIINSLANVSLVEHPFDIVAEGQMKNNCKVAPLSFLVKYMIHSKTTYSERQWRNLLYLAKLLNRINRFLPKSRF